MRRPRAENGLDMAPQASGVPKGTLLRNVEPDFICDIVGLFDNDQVMELVGPGEQFARRSLSNLPVTLDGSRLEERAIDVLGPPGSDCILRLALARSWGFGPGHHLERGNIP